VPSAVCLLLARLLTHPAGLLLSLSSTTNPTLNLACPSSYLLSNTANPSPGALSDATYALSEPLRPREWTITARVQVPSQPGVHCMVAGKRECVQLMLKVGREGQVRVGQRGEDGVVRCAEGEVGRYEAGWHQVVVVSSSGEEGGHRVGYWWDGKKIGETERVDGM
jgi:hypothetical protein